MARRTCGRAGFGAGQRLLTQAISRDWSLRAVVYVGKRERRPARSVQPANVASVVGAVPPAAAATGL